MDQKPSCKLCRLIAIPLGGWGCACLVFAVFNAVHAVGFMSQHWPGEWLVFGRLPTRDDFGVRALWAGIGCLAMGLLWLWAARLFWRAAWRPAASVALAAIVATLAISYGLS